MTDTQERVEVNLTTNGKRFGFLRRLVNSCIASEWSFYKTIAAVVVVAAALYHYHAINYLEASFETTVKKMLDEREQGSKAFIKEAIKESETNMLKRLLDIKSLEKTMEKMLDKREQGSRAFIDNVTKTLEASVETSLARKLEELKRLLVRRNCAEVYKSGRITSGVYTIKLDGAGPDFEVFCDQKTTGGGWIVIQKRFDGTIDFHRNWSDYKNGFGNIDGEFWLGLEKIHRLTQSPSKLRVDLEDFDGKTSYAEYDLIVVATESKKYQLSVGKYSGRAGDSLTEHHGYPFSTKDRDHDSLSSNCAEKYKGGWRHFDCYYSNLNGVYRHKEDFTADGVDWVSWKRKTSLKKAEMKIRPVGFYSIC